MASESEGVLQRDCTLWHSMSSHFLGFSHPILECSSPYYPAVSIQLPDSAFVGRKQWSKLVFSPTTGNLDGVPASTLAWPSQGC